MTGSEIFVEAFRWASLNVFFDMENGSVVVLIFGEETVTEIVMLISVADECFFHFCRLHHLDVSVFFQVCPGRLDAYGGDGVSCACALFPCHHLLFQPP